MAESIRISRMSELMDWKFWSKWAFEVKFRNNSITNGTKLGGLPARNAHIKHALRAVLWLFQAESILNVWFNLDLVNYTNQKYDEISHSRIKHTSSIGCCSKCNNLPQNNAKGPNVRLRREFQGLEAFRCNPSTWLQRRRSCMTDYITKMKIYKMKNLVIRSSCASLRHQKACMSCWMWATQFAFARSIDWKRTM